MKSILIAAVAALAVTATAQAQQANYGVLAPAPGKVVEVNGLKCLMTNLYDTSVWCSGYGKVAVPSCAYPAIHNGKLVCENKIAIIRRQ